MPIPASIGGKVVHTFPDGTAPDAIASFMRTHYHAEPENSPKPQPEGAFTRLGHFASRGLFASEADLNSTVAGIPGLGHTPFRQMLENANTKLRLETAQIHDQPPRGTFQKLLDIGGSVAGSLPVSIPEFVYGKIPFALLHGYTYAKRKGGDWEQQFKDGLTEGGVRYLLGWISGGGVPALSEGLARAGEAGDATLGHLRGALFGRVTSAMAFPMVAAGGSDFEGRKVTMTQVGVNMILGALTGKRLPIDQLEAFHSAQKLATDGEFDSAAKILDPVLRSNPKAQMEVAKAAHRADVVAGMPAIGKATVADLMREGPAGVIKSAKVIADADIAHSKARWEAVGRETSDLLRLRDYWDLRPVGERIAAIDATMRNLPIQHEGDQAAMKVLSQALDHQYELEKEAGVDTQYRSNYFPAFWKQPSENVRNWFDENVWSKPNFQRAKSFDDWSQGLEAGFTPVTTNPAEITMMRLMYGKLAAMKVDAIHRLVEDRVAVPLKDTEAVRTNWEPMDIGGTRYLVHPDAARILRNAFPLPSGSSVNAILQPGTRAFTRNWMALRNIILPMKLSFSAFHAQHITHIHLMDRMATLAKSVADKGLTRLEAAKQLKAVRWGPEAAKGLLFGRYFDSPYEDLGENEQGIKDLFIAGGYVPGRPPILRIELKNLHLRQLREAIPEWTAKKQYGKLATIPFKLLAQGVIHVSRGIQDPLFEEWIPGLKNYAYITASARLLEDHPEIAQEPLLLRANLRRIAKSVDDRYGEMQYGTLFWPPFWKNLGFGTFLSLGWNLGFVRQFGGALVDTARVAGRGLARGRLLEGIAERLKPALPDVGNPNFSSKMLYAGNYIVTALAVGGILTYFSTGKPPTVKDLFYPIGPNGVRLTTTFFTREFAGLYYHMRNQGILPGAVHEVTNKLNPMISGLVDIWTGFNYWGNETRDPNAPLWTQVMQSAGNLAEQELLPISISSILNKGLIDNPTALAFSMAGNNPAPSYADITPFQSAILRAYGRLHGHARTAYAEVAQKEELRKFRESEKLLKKKGKFAELVQKWGAYEGQHPLKARGASRLLKSLIGPPYSGMFRELDTETQVAILSTATPEEVQEYLPHASLQAQIEYPLLHPGRRPGAARGTRQ